MTIVNDIFSNSVFICAVIGWFSSQGIKMFLTFMQIGRFDLERLMGSGGMPSSHTASIMAATFQIGQAYGYDHPAFGLGLVMALIVMYDATNVRMAAGRQAKLIKQIVTRLGEHHFQIEKELKELLGHTYLEVLVGMVLGICIGILYNN